MLVVGSTGSVGRETVRALTAAGIRPRALTRSRERARRTLGDVDLAVAPLRDAAGMADAVAGVDGIVMVHGATGDARPEDVDYGAVPAVLRALAGASPRIVLMTSMAVTHATGSWREAMHWKRRGERLLRASGLPATIVRPGWFDLQPDGWEALALEQGDATPVDSRRPVGRAQIAETIVQSLLCDEAVGCTFELFAAPGAAAQDWPSRFAALAHDRPGEVDGALDPREPPLHEEPDRLLDDLRALGAPGAWQAQLRR
ncbi:NAD-dependent dehydratase [Demequina activiva]|uniref:NAD-dependent dehydratase n=1 Tax=Demequina activiva TaxID=1582364 RepID=A0A919Q559_9MICO|nr:NAD-dependent dehydratase [Demequina activiva]